MNKRLLLIFLTVLSLGGIAATPPLKITTTLGDLIYGGTSGTQTRLAGNTTSTKKFLTQTGNGSVSAAPGWNTIVAGDVPTLNQNTTGNAATATALAANGTNCSAGQYPLGVDASGNAESCAAITSLGTIGTGVWQGTAIGAAYGGTGVTSLTANNVILGNGTSAVQFVAPGTSGNVLTSNGTTWTSAAPSAASVPARADDIINCSIGVTVGSSAVTFTLLDGSGSSLSANSPCLITFRSSTAATGSFSQVSTTSAVSVVGSNGSALGCPTAGTACMLDIYAVNSGSGVVLGIYHGGRLDEGSLQTGTALAGGGADDNPYTLWTTATQTNKPVRFIARVYITPASSFAWTNSVTEISSTRLNEPQKPWYVFVEFTATFILSFNTVASATFIDKNTATMSTRGGSAPAGAVCSGTNAAATPAIGATTCASGNLGIGAAFNIPKPGLYEVCFIVSNYVNMDPSASVQHRWFVVETATNAQTVLSNPVTIGDISANGANAASVTLSSFPAPCAIFDWTGSAAGTTKVAKFMYSQVVSGTLTQNYMNCDGGPGDRSCFMRVREWK